MEGGSTQHIRNYTLAPSELASDYTPTDFIVPVEFIQPMIDYVRMEVTIGITGNYIDYGLYASNNFISRIIGFVTCQKGYALYENTPSQQYLC